MANPWTGPSKLLNTIKYILDNPSVKIKDFTLIDAIGLSKLNKNLPVSKFELKKLITDLKKSAPLLYKKNKAIIENMKVSTKRTEASKIRAREENLKKGLSLYLKKFQEDKRYILRSLNYIHGTQVSGVVMSPKETVINLLMTLPKREFCYGFLVAEQLMAMICYKYDLKEIKSLHNRIHLEHGLATSVMPDNLLSYTYTSKLGLAGSRAVEAFRYYFKKLESEGIKEKCFTKTQMDNYFAKGKDLNKSRVKQILEK